MRPDPDAEFTAWTIIACISVAVFIVGGTYLIGFIFWLFCWLNGNGGTQ